MKVFIALALVVWPGAYRDRVAAQPPVTSPPEPAAPAAATPFEMQAERDRLAAQANKLQEAGKFTEASEVAERMLAIERRLFGEDHGDVLSSLTYLTFLAQMNDDWPAAEARRATAAAWVQKHRKPESWEAGDAKRTAELMQRMKAWSPVQRQQWRAARMELTTAYYLLDDPATAPNAIPKARHALGVYRELFGETSNSFADALNEAGEVLRLRSEYPESKAMLQQGIAIKKKQLGAVHPDVAQMLNNLGRAYAGNGEYVEALEAYQESLDIYRKTQGEEHETTIALLGNLGAAAGHTGDYAKARASMEQCLAMRRKLLGNDHADTVQTVGNLGVLLTQMGDYPSARRCFEEALATNLRLYGENEHRTALTLGNLGRLLHELGDLQGARANLERSLAIERRVLGNDHPDLAVELNNLGALMTDLDDWEAARAYLEECLAVQRKAVGDEHPNVAIATENLATLLSKMGEFALSRKYFEQALAIRIKTLGEDHIDTANSLSNMGGVLMAAGEFAPARAYLERSLAIRRKVLGENHPLVATSLGRLGVLYDDQGEFAAARPYFEQALAIYLKAYGEENPSTAAAYRDVGSNLGHMGDHAAALVYAHKALAIDRKVYGDESGMVAIDLSNISVQMSQQGDREGAMPYGEKALAIFIKVYGEANEHTAIAENNLGAFYSHLGDTSASIRFYLRALETKRKLFGDQHPETAYSFSNLGLELEKTGDYAKARSYFEYAIAVYRKFYGDQHPDLATNLNRLGKLMEWMGEPAKGEEMHREAVEIGAKLMRESAIVQDDQQQLALARSLREYLDEYLSCLSRRADGASAAYRAVLNWKGSLLVRQRAQRVAADEESVRPLYEELQTVVRQWSAVARKPEGDLAKWQKERDELRARKDQLSAELSKRSAAFRQATTAVSVADLEGALPADAALVDFLEFEFSEPHPEQKGTSLTEMSYVAFVLRPGHQIQMFKIDQSKAVAKAIDQWRTSYGSSAEAQRAGALLREHLWAPLVAAIGDAKLVLISPDGALGKFPFAALPGAAPGKYLIDEVGVVMIPVPQLLPALVAAADSKELAREMLVLGGVDYDRRGAAAPAAPVKSGIMRPWERRRNELAQRSITGDGHWGFLPGTDSELGFIRDLYYDATGLPRGSDRVVALRGAEATEEAFRRIAPQAYLLHVATHGFFASADKQSALTRGDSEELQSIGSDDTSSGSRQVVGYDPGLLSGLVLAGANDPPAIPDDPAALGSMPDDGYLTADEIALMPLDGAQLVVLSACESGLGETAGGEGMLGIQRAFQVAGARATISTLWKINDEATRRIMEEFYRNFLDPKKHMTPLESLRAAQRWALDNPDLVPRGGNPPKGQADPAGGGRLPPFYWAAFTLSGDWR